jgi:hypothetical protein
MVCCVRAVVAVALSTTICSSFAYAQCTKDTDCKGDRICRSGACEDPAPAAPANPVADSQPVQPVAPVAAPPVTVAAEEPQKMRSFAGYASVASLVSLHSWVSDAHENIGLGAFAAGYWAQNPSLHLGGYVRASKFTGESPTWSSSPYSRSGFHLGGGISVKVGGCPTEMVWLGSAIDFGAHVALGSSNKVGIEAFPRFEADIYLGGGRFKTALFGSVGPMIATGMSDYMTGASSTVTSLQMLLGIMAGA